MIGDKPSIVVMIPTYDERENIGPLIREILALPVDGEFRILVVDDDSPDGTAGEAARLASDDPRVRVLLRRKRRGRGAAGIDGFSEALRLGADFVVEMDADGSHRPSDIPALLEAARTADLVLGSRFVKGGKDADRAWHRRLVTLCVRAFVSRYYGLGVRDVSSGFRCFRRRTLERIDLEDLISVGPSIILETLYRAHLLGCSIVEVPIVFVDRKLGKTKLSAFTLAEALIMALQFKRRRPPAVR
jgi:dolichol-phosphate mannosyltransferase